MAAYQYNPHLEIVSQLNISLLGGFNISWGDKPITGVKTLRLQALLAYLLLHRAAPISRQQLAFQFWPETSESQARTNLRHLIHSLRSALPESETFLVGDAQVIGWNNRADFTLDVDEFKRSLEGSDSAQTLHDALVLYRGDLLPACYDEWILVFREHLLQLYLAGLERLGTIYEQAGETSLAIQVVKRLLQRDPSKETAYQRLMALHLADEDRASALHAYQTYVTIFQRELGLGPSLAMQQVYEKLLGLKPSETAGPPPGTLHLVGRQQEWERLLTAWRAAVGGKPSLVLVEGEAGIGKTRLAEELLTWVERQGQRACIARCYQTETSLAYAPVTAWLRSGPLPALESVWLSEVARLLPMVLLEHPDLPPPAPLSEAWQRQRLHESLARTILYGDNPLLLLLDDIQWCDSDTLEWLHYLLRYDPNAPILLVATLRSDALDTDHPVGTLLAGLRRSRQLVELALGPLEEHQSTDLAIQAAGEALSAADAAVIANEAEGNPLFIVELAQARPAITSTASASPALPKGIQAVISSRLEQLSPAARQAGEMAAVIGRQFSFPMLVEAAEEDEKTLVSSLDELWLRRIIREQGADGYDFSHDKIRQVMYGELSQTRRRWLHRRAADALEKLQASLPDSAIGEIAYHYDQAGQVNKALEGYQAAAQAARRLYANQEALDWLRRAEMLLPSLRNQALRHQSTLAICESQGDVFKTLGRRPEAILAYQRALQTLGEADRLMRARLNRKLGDTWVEDRRNDSAWSYYAQAQAILEEDPQEQDDDWKCEWLQARIAQMHWYYWDLQWEPMARIAAQIEADMRTFGSSLQQVEYYHLLALKAFLQAGVLGTPESCMLAAKGLQAAREAKDMNAILTMQFSYGMQVLWSGMLEAARAEFTQALASAKNMGNLLLETQCLTYLTIVERQLGNLESVAELAQKSLQAAQAYRRSDYLGVAQANLAWLAWRLEDLPTAREQGQAALETWETGSRLYPIQWVGLWPMIAIHLAQGEVEQAIRLVRKLLDPEQQPEPEEMVQMLELICEADTRGDKELVQGLLQQALSLAQQHNYL
jgi:DNA-binding SARP family transcriptional activator/predicted ATPase